jgi:Asp-tRNA(Asn)/Glu-tRNA(Gln) amidotransferase A subunit family amidase
MTMPASGSEAKWSPLLHSPACDLVRLVKAGDVSAVDIVRAHVDQIGRLDPQLHAFVDLRAEEALVEARTQDEMAARGVPRGPLGGLPVTVKSAIEVKGLRCEAGSPSRRGVVAGKDAVVVSRLRAAGAIVLGTTNVADMLMGYESVNPLHGRTVSPWDPDRTPGGSSGGEAAAIASGCSAAGIGSDGGGSIRVPAHFAGICGLKPTPGRIPASGHQPACLGPFSIIGVVGPMARTVDDLYAIFKTVAGWDAGDPVAAPLPVGSLESHARSDIRLGFFEDDGRTPVTQETRAAVRAAAQAAQEAGFAVEAFRPSNLDRARELWETFFCEIALLVLRDPLKGAEVELPILKEFLRHGRTTTPLTSLALTSAWIDRDILRAEVLGEMETHPVLICPVASIPAFRHGERSWMIDGTEVSYLDAMSYTQWFNVLGNPAAVVPAGRSREGLPIGVQIVGRPFEEELVLSVAAAIEHACGGYRRPPGS